MMRCLSLRQVIGASMRHVARMHTTKRLCGKRPKEVMLEPKEVMLEADRPRDRRSATRPTPFGLPIPSTSKPYLRSAPALHWASLDDAVRRRSTPELYRR
jgi:hypothetical protein